MKKLRSLIALFLSGVLASLLVTNTVVAINLNLNRATTNGNDLSPSSKAQNIIAFVRSSARQRYLQALEKSDQFYNQGALSAVLQIQKEIKEPFRNTGLGRRQPIDDPELLTGGARSYYRNGKSGLDEGLITKALIPLQKLSEDYPEFIPGHIMLAQAARKFSDNDAKIVLKNSKLQVELEALERGSSIFPERKDLLDARIEAFASYDKFIEASVTARQFAALFPNDPDSGKYLALAESYLQKHRQSIQDRVLALGLAGSIFGGRDASAQIALILSLSESDFGAQMAEKAKARLKMVNDPEVVSYVNRIGQKIARSMGRNEFNYEFYVYEDNNSLNAFAYPGGKVFIATGMLNALGTEAELAGVLGHEVAHAVLSHGYIRYIESIAAGAVGDLFGIGFILEGQVADNTRSQEKQSDILGTRSIVASGYSADGVWNVMRVLKAADGGAPGNYLSSHPPSGERVAYLEDFIEKNSFNRYGFEGVAGYRTMQARLTGNGSEAIANQNSSPTATAITNNTASSNNSARTTTNSSNPNSRVAANSRCPSGKVPVIARQARDRVSVVIDGAFVPSSCSSFTANVTIKNDSDREFTFVPGFIQVFTSSGETRKARLVMKKGFSPSVGVGKEVQAELQVFQHKWVGNGSQDLTFEMKEGSSVARVFRLAF